MLNGCCDNYNNTQCESRDLQIFKYIFMSFFISSAIDNQTLETIENTLKQFHAFLDILNEKG